MGGAFEDPRLSELAANLSAVHERIASACARSGREAGGVTLVAITKTWPASDVVRLVSLGVSDIGENRDQEAAPKARDVAAAGVRVRWHFVGQLQRNKCRSVVTYAHLVHSLDGVRLAHTLSAAAERHRGSVMDVLVQLSIDGDPARGGAFADSADSDRSFDRVVETAASADGLSLCGVMAVAPLGWEPVRAYAILADAAERFRVDHPDAVIISAGMSDDIESAIDYGATHVRIGSALLGNRPTLL